MRGRRIRLSLEDATRNETRLPEEQQANVPDTCFASARSPDRYTHNHTHDLNGFEERTSATLLWPLCLRYRGSTDAILGIKVVVLGIMTKRERRRQSLDNYRTVPGMRAYQLFFITLCQQYSHCYFLFLLFVLLSEPTLANHFSFAFDSGGLSFIDGFGD